jgi:hypothetical protein
VLVRADERRKRSLYRHSYNAPSPFRRAAAGNARGPRAVRNRDDFRADGEAHHGDHAAEKLSTCNVREHTRSDSCIATGHHVPVLYALYDYDLGAVLAYNACDVASNSSRVVE